MSSALRHTHICYKIKSAMEEKKKEKEKDEVERERNWAGLPLELFPLILKRFPDVCDFIRFRAVCKPWRFSTSVSELPLQFPWVLKLSRSRRYRPTDLECYSFAYNKVFFIRAPICSGKWLFEHAGGYILACPVGYDRDDSPSDHLSLVNPLKNSEVPLPVLEYDSDTPLDNLWSVHWIRPSSFKYDDYVIVTDRANRLAVCKPGNDRWDIIGSAISKRCFYLKGLLFLVDLRTRVTTVMDIVSHKELYVIPPPESEKRKASPNIVECSGEILGVCSNYSDQWNEMQLGIYRLELGNEEGHPCWVKVTNIGDRILFFDVNNGHGFCLRKDDFDRFSENSSTIFKNLCNPHNYCPIRACVAAAAGFKGNYIYFVNMTTSDSRNSMIGMYDIEKGELFSIHCPLFCQGVITWYMPTLYHI